MSVRLRGTWYDGPSGSPRTTCTPSTERKLKKGDVLALVLDAVTREYRAEETVIAPAALPAPIKAGLQASKYQAGGSPRRSRWSTTRSPTLAHEVVVQSEKEKFEVVLDRTGKIMKEEAKSPKDTDQGVLVGRRTFRLLPQPSAAGGRVGAVGRGRRELQGIARAICVNRDAPSQPPPPVRGWGRSRTQQGQPCDSGVPRTTRGVLARCGQAGRAVPGSGRFMRLSGPWWAFVLVALLAGAPAASADERPPDPAQLAALELEGLPEVSDAGPTPGDLEALRARIRELVGRYRTPGAAVAMVGPRGELLVEGFGRAADDRPMDADALFRVGSITKSFISLAVMRLVEQGKLRLEDRVQALAPELGIRNPFERTHPLRVAHLLEHTSGFDEMRFNEILDEAPERERSLREILAVNPRSRIPRWQPGTRFSYSQPGYTTAAYLIEKASGMPYARYLEEEVFAPLGIRASVRLTDEVRGRLAQGHEKGQPQRYLHLLHRPSMNLMISVRGMSRLIQMLLGRGTIEGRHFLSPESIARIERNGTLPYGPASIRYGLGNWGDVSTPVHTRGHGGFMPGYASVYRYSVARGFGFAVMVNDSEGWDTLAPINAAIFRYLLRGQPPGPAPERPQPAPVLARWAGHYRLASPEIEFLRFKTDVYVGVDVIQRDGALFLTELRREPLTRQLVATGPDTFRYPRQIDSSVQFIRDAGGGRVVIVGQNYYEEEASWWAAARRWALELALLLMTSTGLIPLLLLLRRNPAEAKLLLPPLLAALCLWGMSRAFDTALMHGDLGLRTGATVTVWLLSWGFGLLSYTAAGRAGEAGREVAAGLRVYALAVSGAAAWIALHLSRYGLIGLRTWRW